MKRKKTNNKTEHGFSNLKVPLLYVLIFLILDIGYICFIIREVYFEKPERPGEIFSNERESGNYEIKRKYGYKFIKPLLSAKKSEEYRGYKEIKKAIYNYICENKNKGIISTASVFLEDLDNANWAIINNQEKYSPGSMYKIPAMMTILLKEEESPGFLDQKVLYKAKIEWPKGAEQFIKPEKHIVWGNTYTVRQLLEYMIIHSDNEAYTILQNIMDRNKYSKLVAEFGLPKPTYKTEDPITVADCSIFLEALVNSTVLSQKQSEYALNLLSRAAFNEGIIKGIGNSKELVAHKFAEGGTFKNKELHETGVIYFANRPFLITIMTRGQDGIDYSVLEKCVQEISRIVYKSFLKDNNSSSS